MSEIEEILQKITELRKELENLIEQKKNLIDPEVVVASQMLDSILNEYNKIVKSKTDS
ncbi:MULTISPECIES: aspartyl-phosphate phosphatase Spo0E family protein [Clostridium]|uniref:Spo0E like sporulation regulatory protein n=1 Tax=Clostridium ragsdalei P11 TaxID=1353534 RepID=A0A1A6AJM8_9CLOT|nr:MULTISPECIES: aspartyl-phosphate phosphatase Spo0E family protein [Clostridium]OBR90277.1 Spo0E like sporulation regulatory protein [Clostridium ragsdalei P11]QXE18087.1 aspartyl-phosphate phosphatase Spo0E family protein [Clostridium sp. 001]